MAHCFYHSSQPASFVCFACNKGVCRNCIIEVEGETFCQVCWEGYLARHEAANPVAQTVAQPEGSIPWSQRRRLGFFRAFVDTFKMVAFDPKRFFSKMPVECDFRAPLFFAVICLLVFWMPMQVFYIKIAMPYLLNSSALIVEEAAGGASFPAIEMETFERYKSIAQLPLYKVLLMPLDYLIFQVLIASALQQVMVLMFRGENGYMATFQIRCYAMAIQCLYLIPFVGILLTEIVTLIVSARGFQTVQKLPLVRSFLVSSVPLLYLSLRAFV